jgi:hypothetical protein
MQAVHLHPEPRRFRLNDRSKAIVRWYPQNRSLVMEGYWTPRDAVKIDESSHAGELPTMPSVRSKTSGNAQCTTTRVDSRRRVVMPTTLPPDALVSIQQLADDCWVVRRIRPSRKVRAISVPIVDELPRNARWEKVESGFAEAAAKYLAPFEE